MEQQMPWGDSPESGKRGLGRGTGCGSAREPMQESPDERAAHPGSAVERAWQRESRGAGAWLARFAYTHNPFYVLSAGLVLYGLHVMCRPSESGWALLGALAGYTVALAAMAVVIIRLGHVWDDARTVLLTVALLLVAISTSFDELTAADPASGVPVLLVGLGFAIGLSEVLMRAARVRLPALYRLPYYALLLLFFLYPLVPLVNLSADASLWTVPLAWSVLLFPAFAAAAFLLLVPAIRKGAGHVRDSGTPWSWPAFPLVLFAVLWLAACGRSFLLTISLYPGPGMESPWGVFFLAPLLFCASVLLLETGLATADARVRAAGLLLPLAAIALSFPGSPDGVVELQFQSAILRSGISPALLGALAGVVCYAYAWLRGQRLAEAGLAISVVVASMLGTRTMQVSELAAPHVLPILGFAAFQVAQLWRRPASWRAVAASGSVAVALGLALRGQWWPGASWVVPLHLFVGAALVVGIVWRDPFARVVQKLGAFALWGLFAAALFGAGRTVPQASAGALAVYLVVLAAVTLAYGLRQGRPLYVYAFLLDGAEAVARLVWAALSHAPREGALAFLCGAGLFALAAFISLAKGGIIARLAARVRQLAHADP